MISKNGIHSVPAVKILQGVPNDLWVYSALARATVGHQISENQNQIRVLCIGSAYDPVQLCRIDEGRSNMDVGNHSDPNSIEFMRPVRKRYRFAMNDKPAGFNDESPESEDN